GDLPELVSAVLSDFRLSEPRLSEPRLSDFRLPDFRPSGVRKGAPSRPGPEPGTGPGSAGGADPRPNCADRRG
ncbi:MAG: hypothetical protein ACRDYE_08625, partial [Acidimicrobiales bacterium]